MKSGRKLWTCVLAGMLGLFTFIAMDGSALSAGIKGGEDGFRKYCQACHPNGGNVLRPVKNISRSVMEKNGIKTAKDIVRIMRHPGDDMTRFDEKTLPESEATNIAEYILKTF